MAESSAVADELRKIRSQIVVLAESARRLVELLDHPGSASDPACREILTEEEVANLTGYKVRTRQIKWLQDRGWRHELSGGGRPIVGREYLRHKLSGGKAKADPQLHLSTWQPDFSNINPPPRPKKSAPK